MPNTHGSASASVGRTFPFLWSKPSITELDRLSSSKNEILRASAAYSSAQRRASGRVVAHFDNKLTEDDVPGING
ncbi:hypothetical protein F8568_000485 [Actinomadura sp. LD22]|uniref:Uncharacterized protein n=1 Tax=Actinomadura physcomitrii TaxID=2650748 RepID=A0A6I4M3H3_9ACTN|nr:hypothetical protein [Actinomadura physcomitrii]MVZ98883.1 hypothetical protein [Actinomadura physcomitrii]